MKLYEVNEKIENVFDQIVDPETGEVLSDSNELMERLDALQMKRMDILSYLAKLVLNIRSDEAVLKTEEERLRTRRERLEKKEESLMKVLDRECGGERTDLGIATFSYRKTEHVDISDPSAAVNWLLALFEIAKFQSEEKGMHLGPDVKGKLLPVFEEARQTENFGNGRFVRNLIEKAQMRQATRLVRMDYDRLTNDDVTTLTAEDFDNIKLGIKAKKTAIGF